MAKEAETPFDVFLSYCRADEAQVRLLQDSLERLEVRVWRDTGQILPGDTWIKNIETGLRQSNCVLLFNSERALASEWVQREWNVALALKKRIVPVRLDGADLPLLLTATEFIDFHENDDVQKTAEQIFRGIRRATSVPPQQTPEAASNPSVIGRDVAILDRMIENQRKNERSLQVARYSAALLAFTAAVAIIAWSGAALTLWTAIGVIAALMVAGAIAWAITARLNSSRSTTLRLGTIKDAIELYCPQQAPCVQFRTELEKFLKERAGVKEVQR
jgi:TIR domain-containing protein